MTPKARNGEGISGRPTKGKPLQLHTARFIQDYISTYSYMIHTYIYIYICT